MEDIYQKKYLKYKEKYLELKEHYHEGGAGRIGGQGNYAFDIGEPVFIMEYIRDRDMLFASAERLKSIPHYGDSSLKGVYGEMKIPQVATELNGTHMDGSLKEPKRGFPPPIHITIFNFQINRANDHSRIFDTDFFKAFLRWAYDEDLSNLTLEKDPRGYKRLGTTDRQFMAKTFESDEAGRRISNFRTKFYNWVNYVLGYKLNNEFRTINDKTYRIFDTIDGTPLFAVPEVNYGYGNWKAHVTLGYGKEENHIEKDIAKIGSINKKAPYGEGYQNPFPPTYLMGQGQLVLSIGRLAEQRRSII